jgi:hypothetical protein
VDIKNELQKWVEDKISESLIKSLNKWVSKNKNTELWQSVTNILKDGKNIVSKFRNLVEKNKDKIKDKDFQKIIDDNRENIIWWIGDEIWYSKDTWFTKKIKKWIYWIMQWTHLADLISKWTSPTFVKYFVTAPMEKINRFNIRINTVDKFLSKIVWDFKIKTKEQAEALGRYSFIMQRTKDKTLWWDRIFWEYKWYSDKLRKELELPESEWVTQENIFEVNPDEWNIIRKTKIGKDLFDVHNNKDWLKDAFDNIMKFMNPISDEFELSAIKHDWIFIWEKRTNYLWFINKWYNLQTDLDANLLSTWPQNKIYDWMLHHTTIVWWPYEYDIFTMVKASARNMLYYKEMKWVVSKMNSIFNELNNNKLIWEDAKRIIWDFIDWTATWRMTIDWSDIAKTTQKIVYWLTSFASKKALMFNATSAAVQFASYVEMVSELWPKYSWFWATVYAKWVRDLATQRSSFLYNRLKLRYQPYQELWKWWLWDYINIAKRVDDWFTDAWLYLLWKADQKVATDVWLWAYKKKFDSLWLNEIDFSKLNIQECIDYADLITQKTMGTTDYIFKSSLWKSIFWAILQPLANSQQSKFWYYFSKWYNRLSTEWVINSITPALFFAISTATETAIRYVIKAAKYEMWLSKVNPFKDKEWNEKEINDYLLEFTKNNINNIPIISTVNSIASSAINWYNYQPLWWEAILTNIVQWVNLLIKEENKLKWFKKNRKETNNRIDWIIKLWRAAWFW